MFPRGAPEPVPEGPAPFANLGVFSLLDAFERVLKKAKIHLDHEVVFDRISITDRMLQLSDLLKNRRRVSFEDLLLDVGGQARGVTRFDLVITFLAVLEMCKLHMIRVFQTDALSAIHVELSVQEPGEGGDLERGDFDGEGVDA